MTEKIKHMKCTAINKMWLGYRTSDSVVTDSIPGRRTVSSNLGQVIHTYVPLLAEDYGNKDKCYPTGPCGLGRILRFYVLSQNKPKYYTLVSNTKYM